MYRCIFLLFMLVSLPSESNEFDSDYEQVVATCNEAVEGYKLCDSETTIGARKQCLTEAKELIEKDCALLIRAGEIQKQKQSENNGSD